jgi:hypothetical protein
MVSRHLNDNVKTKETAIKMIAMTDVAITVDATEIETPEHQIAIAARVHALTEIVEMTDIVHLLLLIGEAAVVQAVAAVGAIEDLHHHYLETALTLLVEDPLFLLYPLLTVEDGTHRFLIDHILEPDLVAVGEEVTMTDATIDHLIQLQDEKEVLLHG